jgi:excisionase family DNA binding protein
METIEAGVPRVKAHRPGMRLLLTPDEAAVALGIKRTKLYHLMATGQISSVKIGALRRFPLRSLEIYIERLSEMERAG